MANHTLEKPTDWWWLHSPLVIPQNLARIPAITQKVDLPSSTEKESTQSFARSTQRTPYFKRGPPTGPRTCRSCRYNGWSNEGPWRRQWFFCLVPIEARRRHPSSRQSGMNIFTTNSLSTSSIVFHILPNTTNHMHFSTTNRFPTLSIVIHNLTNTTFP